MYADYAATSPVSEDVLAEMLPYFREQFGNPSGVHRASRGAAKAVMEARKRIAAAIGAEPSEIYFTSGGTESDNWALFSAVRSTGKKHIVTIIKKVNTINPSLFKTYLNIFFTLVYQFILFSFPCLIVIFHINILIKILIGNIIIIINTYKNTLQSRNYSTLHAGYNSN